MGVAARAADDVDFLERLQGLNEELKLLNAEARGLEEQISENMSTLFQSPAL